MCEQKTTAETKVDRLIDELSTMNTLLREVVQRLDARSRFADVLNELPKATPDVRT